MEFEIQKQNDVSQKIKVHDIFIDQDYIQKWGLKTTQDGKRSYWRVRGDLHISKSSEDIKTTTVSFRINLTADEKTLSNPDEDFLALDLKRALDSFKRALKKQELEYKVITKGTWNNQGKTIDYDGWIELKVRRIRHKVSILED